MRAALVALLIAAAAPARADDRPQSPMDGPVEDVCEALRPTDGACRVVARGRAGGVAYEVVVQSDDPIDPKRPLGDYRVAVKTAAGWMFSHDEMYVEEGWGTHGSIHHFYPGAPRARALALASKRPAIAIDVPIDDPLAGGRPTALIACGERADGTWACIVPITTELARNPPIRFRRDGTLVGDLLALPSFRVAF